MEPPFRSKADGVGKGRPRPANVCFYMLFEGVRSNLSTREFNTGEVV